jgi:putative peptide zinc metalloprotease protein
VASVPEPPAVGQAAPLFSLTSVQGGSVDLATYRGRRNVVVWFSRGFTCPFCRVYMDGMSEGYEHLQATGTEVIQVGPNLLQSALGDRGALEATRSASAACTTTP